MLKLLLHMDPYVTRNALHHPIFNHWKYSNLSDSLLLYSLIWPKMWTETSPQILQNIFSIVHCNKRCCCSWYDYYWGSRDPLVGLNCNSCLEIKIENMYFYLIVKYLEILLKCNDHLPTNIDKCYWHLLSYLWRMSKHISRVMVITIPQCVRGRKNIDIHSMCMYLSHRSGLWNNWLRWSLCFLWLCSFRHRLQGHSMVSTKSVYLESLSFYKTTIIYVTYNFYVIVGNE
jgi:hypothetical protein